MPNLEELMEVDAWWSETFDDVETKQARMPQAAFRLSASLLARVDNLALRAEVTRSRMLVELLKLALARVEPALQELDTYGGDSDEGTGAPCTGV